MDNKLSEEDVKRQYITPAIEDKWGKSTQNIRMEVKITDGRVNIKGNVAFRETKSIKRADYVLYKDGSFPLAVVEAKDGLHSVSDGMQQAKQYAVMLDVKFAYSSNGEAFQEYDFLTGQERTLALSEFPSPEELTNRLRQDGKISDKELSILAQPYYSSQNTPAPRYYQQVAIDRTLEAVARGQKRLLLVMATGTGKTFTAFQIVYRLLKSGWKHKILYLADRNVLVDQSIQQDFSPLAKVTHKVNFSRDNPDTVTAYEVYFALYQQMVGKDDVPHFQELFEPNFFDLVIVDECHRGSAKEESRWRRVLDYFSEATHIGMTATPKETKYVSNIDYFGDPIYTYSLKQGIEDGFLAPFRVVNIHTNIGDGWRPTKGQLDAAGQEIEDRIYNNTDYDYHIIVEDRVREVAERITEYLKSFDRYAKTIVFCATEDAAERMRVALTNCNADMMRENSDYVVRITGSDDYGKSKLDYFNSVSAKFPVIATTSDLMTTGVDCKMVKVLALDRNIGSMTMFKQIVGRGTRLRYEDGKTSFTIIDFRDVTRLFADPEWDGPIESDPGFTGGGGGTPQPKPTLPGEPRSIPVVTPDGCKVFTTNKLVQIYDVSGKLLRQESIVDYTKRNVNDEYGSLDNFIRKWSATEKKQIIADELAKKGIDLDKAKQDMNLSEVDDYDFICHVAYGQKPLTRRERANNVKKRDFLHRFSDKAREVLDILLEKYMNFGIRAIEKNEILKMDEFRGYGKPNKIKEFFGGVEKFKIMLK